MMLYVLEMGRLVAASSVEASPSAANGKIHHDSVLSINGYFEVIPLGLVTLNCFLWRCYGDLTEDKKEKEIFYDAFLRRDSSFHKVLYKLRCCHGTDSTRIH